MPLAHALSALRAGVSTTSRRMPRRRVRGATARTLHDSMVVVHAALPDQGQSNWFVQGVGDCPVYLGTIQQVWSSRGRLILTFVGNDHSGGSWPQPFWSIVSPDQVDWNQLIAVFKRCVVWTGLISMMDRAKLAIAGKEALVLSQRTAIRLKRWRLPMVCSIRACSL